MHQARNGAGEYFGVQVSESRYVGRRTKGDLLSGVVGEVSESKLTARNTVRYRTADGEQRLRYHDTDVVTVFRSGKIGLTSGGWKTVTTKARINEELAHLGCPVRVWADRGRWWVHGLGDERLPFVDGIAFQKSRTEERDSGVWELWTNADTLERDAAADAELVKLVKAYCDHLKKELQAGNAPHPVPGDCFICQSDKVFDREHLLRHVRAKQFNGHLVIAALRWAGWTDKDLPYTYGQRFINSQRVVDAVRRFLRKAFGLTQ